MKPITKSPDRWKTWKVLCTYTHKLTPKHANSLLKERGFENN